MANEASAAKAKGIGIARNQRRERVFFSCLQFIAPHIYIYIVFTTSVWTTCNFFFSLANAICSARDEHPFC